MLNERDTSGEEPAKSTEFYDARERASKAKWHYDRVGKHKHASLKKGIENDYRSQLLKRGVRMAEEVALELLEHPQPRGHSLRINLKSKGGLTYTHYSNVPERNTSTQNEHSRAVEHCMNHPDCEHSKHGPWKVTSSHYES